MRALARSARRAGNFLRLDTVAGLLLDAKCVLTPSQARRLFNSLKSYFMPADKGDWERRAAVHRLLSLPIRTRGQPDGPACTSAYPACRCMRRPGSTWARLPNRPVIRPNRSRCTLPPSTFVRSSSASAATERCFDGGRSATAATESLWRPMASWLPPFGRGGWSSGDHRSALPGLSRRGGRATRARSSIVRGRSRATTSSATCTRSRLTTYWHSRHAI